MSATIVLINMVVIHNTLNEYLNELLKYLSTVLLLRRNQLPKNYYEAKNMIRKLGLNYKQIHVCPSAYTLYKKEHQNLKSYPKVGCGKSRYMLNSKSSLAKVVRWFLFIPRMMHMY